MLKDKLIELLKVKSIVTILVFSVFAYLSIIGKIDTADYMFILGMVATYYFTKAEKKETM